MTFTKHNHQNTIFSKIPPYNLFLSFTWLKKDSYRKSGIKYIKRSNHRVFVDTSYKRYGGRIFQTAVLVFVRCKKLLCIQDVTFLVVGNYKGTVVNLLLEQMKV